jgi:hypothetical protein
MEGGAAVSQNIKADAIALAAEVACLRRENAVLRQDSARLDWLTNSLGWIVVGNLNEADPSQHATGDSTLADAWRAAIDAARKEAQP